MKFFIPFNLMQNADRTGMAHSIDLQSPFLATPLVHAMLELPWRTRMGRDTKPMIRSAFGHAMPRVVLEPSKQPFNPPIRELLRVNLSSLEDYLVAPTAHLSTVIEPKFVLEELAAFSSRLRDNSTFLWGPATLENWSRTIR